MPSMQTIFRLVVMVVIGAVVVKGWRLYGPTNEQVQAAVVHVQEFVQSKLGNERPAAVNAIPDPRPGGLTPIPPANGLSLPTAPFAQGGPPQLLPSNAAPPPTPALAPIAQQPPSASVPVVTPASGDRLPELMTRLQQLGAADTKLAPWGGGNLYRFSCKAPLPSAPAMTQHFESVAAEPTAAVEQVLAKVEAWRVAQRGEGTLRY